MSEILVFSLGTLSGFILYAHLFPQTVNHNEIKVKHSSNVDIEQIIPKRPGLLKRIFNKKTL